jgi:hypothetical protein
MNDDWRVRIDLHQDGIADRLAERLESSELEHDLESSFHDRVVVSRDGAELFCYAGTREQADRAANLIRSLAAENGWEVDLELRRWHPTAEEWEDPDKPLPQSDDERLAEHQELMRTEREEAQARGFPEFEVRVECPSRRAAAELAQKLREEGMPSVHRSSYLLVGALDEDSANALAERLRHEAPAGSTVRVEGTGRAALAEQPSNPFAFMGGLAG